MSQGTSRAPVDEKGGAIAADTLGANERDGNPGGGRRAHDDRLPPTVVLATRRKHAQRAGPVGPLDPPELGIPAARDRRYRGRFRYAERGEDRPRVRQRLLHPVPA